MNVTTMQMSPFIARAHFKEYRKKVRAHRAERLAKAASDVHLTGRALRSARAAKTEIEKEDTILMAAYAEMAKGQRILNIQSVLQAAGLNKQQLPVLAIGRADWKEAVLTTRQRYSVQHYFLFSRDRWGGSTDGRGNYRYGDIEVPLRTFTANLQNQEWRKSNNLPTLPATALLPSIPPHLRPKGDLAEYYILWEAEWKATAPVDPLLLKHVAGFIYTVVAQWDLTPIERSVLEGRIQ